MKYLVTSEEMKRYDKYTSEILGVPEVVLMERAALGCVDDILDYMLVNSVESVCIICGYGNNGADGLALARLLSLKGISVSTILIGDDNKASELNKLQLKILNSYNIAVTKLSTSKAKEYFDTYDNKNVLLIDAIFGIGVNRPFNEDIKQLIGSINLLELPVFALDIPSGLNVQNAISGDVIRCIRTFCFGFIKLSCVLFPSAEYCGEVVLIDMGIDERSICGEAPKHIKYDSYDEFNVPKRKEGANKGTYKKLLIIAGSENVYGALYLASRAAFACGIGMVKILTHENNKELLAQNLPEAMCEFYTEDISHSELKNMFTRAEAWADGILIGPGLGLSNVAYELTRMSLIESNKDILIDADAIRIIGSNIHLMNESNNMSRNITLTPHLAELAALTGISVTDIKLNLETMPKEVADKLGITLVCKDARTIIAGACEELSYINCTGNEGMATAGSGDVLAGIIAVLMLQMDNNIEAAVFGAYIHGLAGGRAMHKYGSRAMVASNIYEELKDIWS